RAWGSIPFLLSKGWEEKPLWLEKSDTEPASFEHLLSKSSIGLLAQSTTGAPVRLNITLDGERVPNEVRGHDVQEDKSGNSFVIIKNARLYDLISHSSNLKDAPLRLKLTTSSKGLKIWSLQSVPFC